MKYLILLGDGMADYPLKELGNKTPLKVAQTESMDSIASMGKIGMVRTIPQGLPPGSDVANMSILGYDPKHYHTGRAVYEAASAGVKIDLNENLFEIKAKMKKKLRFADLGIYYRQGEFSSIRCQVHVPVDVDASKMTISYRGRIWEIRLPRKKR